MMKYKKKCIIIATNDVKSLCLIDQLVFIDLGTVKINMNYRKIR